jgi:hypothetical protein
MSGEKWKSTLLFAFDQQDQSHRDKDHRAEDVGKDGAAVREMNDRQTFHSARRFCQGSNLCNDYSADVR